MFKKNLSKRKNRLKRLKAIRSLISRKACDSEKIQRLKDEADSLVTSIR